MSRACPRERQTEREQRSRSVIAEFYNRSEDVLCGREWCGLFVHDVG